MPRSTGIGRNRAPLERARALLAQSGWRVKDGVRVNRRGEPFEIEFLSRDGADQRTLLPYLGILKLLGITGRIKQVEAAQFVNLSQKSDYDARVTRNDILQQPLAKRLPGDRRVAIGLVTYVIKVVPAPCTARSRPQ